VDFELTSDQEALRDGVRKLCEGRFPIDVVRAGFDRGRWGELADAGVFALRLPESDGGVGLGMAEAVLVFEELGRALVAGPVVGTHLAAGVVDGADVVTVVERSSPVIDHLRIADAVCVIDDAGVWRVDPESIDADDVGEPLDALTPMARVAASGLPQGEQVAAADVAARWRVEGAVLTAALCLGLSEAATDLAVAYAKEREQFGKPIAGFQLVQELLADMAVETDAARLLTWRCADLADRGEPFGTEASMAKLYASEAAVRVANNAIQVFGGYGYIDEYPVGKYLRDTRVTTLYEGTSQIQKLLIGRALTGINAFA
jgi:alkylation response protein AidB-like acyl-CoA dehydrogenase